MKVAKCPSEELSLTNCVIINNADFTPQAKCVEYIILVSIIMFIEISLCKI